MYRFLLNGYIQRIGLFETILDHGQPVTHQTRIKLKSFLKIRNYYNFRKFNQRSIHMSLLTGYITNTD